MFLFWPPQRISTGLAGAWSSLWSVGFLRKLTRYRWSPRDVLCDFRCPYVGCVGPDGEQENGLGWPEGQGQLNELPELFQLQPLFSEEAWSRGISWDLPRLAGESWDRDLWVLGAGGCCSGLYSWEEEMSFGPKATPSWDPLRSGIMFTGGFAVLSAPQL